MALFGKKKAEPATAEPDDEDAAEAPAAEVAEESPVELKQEALAPKSGKGGGILGLIASAAVVTLIAAGGGVALGMKTNAAIEKIIADRDVAAAKVAAAHPIAVKFSGDTVVRQMEPVVTNLATPSDTWIRIEMAMLFKNGAVANPEATAAELRQDVVAYLRTINLAQLEGPSALQHLREDLNERANLRTGGQVSELIIQTMVVQ